MRGGPGTSGSPKTHFSALPRFLGTIGDHENKRISFPALFRLNPNNESGILCAPGSLTALLVSFLSMSYMETAQYTPEG